MPDTLIPGVTESPVTQEFPEVGGKRSDEPKPPTKPVRMHIDLAETVEQLAGVFKMSVPDFMSAAFWPVIHAKRQEAARLLMEDPGGKKKNGKHP